MLFLIKNKFIALSCTFYMLYTPAGLCSEYAYVANKISNSISTYGIVYGIDQFSQRGVSYEPYKIRVNPLTHEIFVLKSDFDRGSINTVYVYNNSFAIDGEKAVIDIFQTPSEIIDIKFYNGMAYIICKRAVYLYVNNQLLLVFTPRDAFIQSLQFSDNKAFILVATDKNWSADTYNLDAHGRFIHINNNFTGLGNTPPMQKVIADGPNANFLYMLNKDNIFIYNNYTIGPLKSLKKIACAPENCTDLISINDTAYSSYTYVVVTNKETKKSIIKIYLISLDKVAEIKILAIQSIDFGGKITAIDMSSDDLYLYFTIAEQNKIYKYNRDIFTGRLIPVSWANTGYGPISISLY